MSDKEKQDRDDHILQNGAINVWQLKGWDMVESTPTKVDSVYKFQIATWLVIIAGAAMLILGLIKGLK